VGSNPTLSATHKKNAQPGVFLWVAERMIRDENPTVRQICQEQIWTAAGWPRSAKRGGVRSMDGPNNPTRHITVTANKAGAFVSPEALWKLLISAAMRLVNYLRPPFTF
jgi:hypothetical protein